MPTGIILKSQSPGATKEDLEKVLKGAGLEVEADAEVIATPEEPKRDDFDTEEDFEAAHVDWQDKQEESAKDDDEEEEERPAAQPHKKSRKERAIERATAPLLARIQELEKGTKKAEAQPVVVEEKRPARGEFAQGDEGQQKYEDALLAWGTKKALADQKVKDAESANKTRLQENLASYGAQVEEAKDKYEDWDDVVNQEIFIGKEVQLAILEQENGAEVIYYLGRHPAYATKLGELTPLSAVMEVGRLSSRLKTGAPAPGEANSGTPAKPKPRVPAPVRPVNTGGTSGALTFAEIAAKPAYVGKARDLKRAQAAGR